MWNVKDVEHDINDINLLLFFYYLHSCRKKISLESSKSFRNNNLMNLFILFNSKKVFTWGAWVAQ